MGRICSARRPILDSAEVRAVSRIHTSDQWSRSVVVCPIDPIASRQTSEQLLRLSGCGRGEPDESTGAINEDNHLIWLLGSTQDTVTLLVPIVSRVRRALGACESIEPLPPSTFSYYRFASCAGCRVADASQALLTGTVLVAIRYFGALLAPTVGQSAQVHLASISHGRLVPTRQVWPL